MSREKLVNNMKKNDLELIFLFNTPALETDISKYRFDDLSKRCNKVIVCDLSPVLNADVNEIVTADRMKSETIEVITFYNWNDIYTFVRNHRFSGFFFPMFDDFYEVRFIYYLFVFMGIRYGYVNNLNADVNDVSIPKIENKKRSFSEIKRGVYNRWGRKFNLLNPAQIYFYSNNISKKHYFWRGNCSDRKTKKVGVHSYDYDRFLSTEPYEMKDYAVYLDVFFPYHPDLIENKIVCDPECYFTNMEEIFTELEKKEGCKVLVAAHPRANYNDKKYGFRKDRIIYGNTVSLVKGASFLIGSWSTTNQMAVMADKPLVIICDDQVWQNERLRGSCINQSSFFGSPLIRKKDQIAELTLNYDKTLYEEIKAQYICSDNTNAPNLWEEILVSLKNVICK